VIEKEEVEKGQGRREQNVLKSVLVTKGNHLSESVLTTRELIRLYNEIVTVKARAEQVRE
jgi:hypothetical protein